MRTGHKVEKGKTGKRTLYIRLKRRYADNNIGDGAGDEVDEMRDNAFGRSEQTFRTRQIENVVKLGK